MVIAPYLHMLPSYVGRTVRGYLWAVPFASDMFVATEATATDGIRAVIVSVGNDVFYVLMIACKIRDGRPKIFVGSGYIRSQYVSLASINQNWAQRERLQLGGMQAVSFQVTEAKSSQSVGLVNGDADGHTDTIWDKVGDRSAFKKAPK